MTPQDLKPVIAFKQSPHCSPRGGAEVRLIVLHSAECGESATAAENLASWGGSKSGSWHYAVDNNSTTQSVPDNVKAWHAREVNAYSIGIEQAGKASQTTEQWADEYSLGALERTAHLLAYLCNKHSIPIEFVDAQGLLDAHGDGGAWGITTHAMVSKAFKTGGHWDPGPNYPLAKVLARADEITRMCGVKK